VADKDAFPHLFITSRFCYFAGLVTFDSPYIPLPDDLRHFAAEIWLIGGIAANLVIPFATRRPNLPCAIASLMTLLAGLVALLHSGQDVSSQHFNGMLLFDSTAWAWKVILLPFTAAVVILWIGHSGRTLRQGNAPEFFVLLLGATLGMCLMASTTHLLMIIMSVAMASLPSYLLAGFAKRTPSAAEASLKYVLFGAVTGAIMLYGLSFLYGVFGTLQLTDLPTAGSRAETAAIALAMVGLLIGVGFKISAVPLHSWCPDVFEGSSIEVTTFLSVASKGAALILLLRIAGVLHDGHFNAVIGWLGALTATVGNTAAFSQENIKRLLAYSSIAQAGYLLCLISVVGNPAVHASADSTSGALLLYLAIYAVMNLGAFSAAAIVIGRNGDRLENFAGLGRSSPLIAGAFFCCLISLIGLPPFAGFGVKLNILWVLAQGGGFGIFLVGVIVLNTVLSAFYYFRIVRWMYLEPANDRSRARDVFSRDPLGVLLATGCALGLVLMFFGFGSLYSLLSRSPGDAATAQAATVQVVAVQR
jgi:NADH-quinone oxidoreductase subunit N